jgi:hypothetical protein
MLDMWKSLVPIGKIHTVDRCIGLLRARAGRKTGSDSAVSWEGMCDGDIVYPVQMKLGAQECVAGLRV